MLRRLYEIGLDAFYTFLADDGWAIASHIALSTRQSASTPGSESETPTSGCTSCSSAATRSNERAGSGEVDRSACVQLTFASPAAAFACQRDDVRDKSLSFFNREWIRKAQ